MKKKILAIAMLAMLCVSAFGSVVSAAEAYKERIMVMTNKHDDEIAEINYYLQNGGTVTHMDAVDKDPKVVYCYLVVRYPASLPDYVKSKQ